MNLSDIKGLGTVRIKKLNEAGIFTPLDLCCHFPYKYINAAEINNFDGFADGDEVVGVGEAIKIEKKVIRSNLRFTKVEFQTANGARFWATWFNQPYINNVIKEGKQYLVIGRLAHRAGRVELAAPTLKNVESGGAIIPVYKGTGLTSSLFKEAVSEVFKAVKIDGFLPNITREQYGLMDTAAAFYAAHFPATLQEANEARRSLSLENLAGYIALFALAKQQNITKKPHSYNNFKDISNYENYSKIKQNTIDTQNLPNNILKNLSFELTDDQKAAHNRIINLLNGTQPANILIEGDVGCGKTIVCLLAMHYAASAGHQSVLMSPTEILARQHYHAAAKLFGYQNIEFLSGSQTAAQRANSAFNIKVGNAKMIIGTHSVFTKDIEYQDLTLVITDEQHRFGVNQRGALENKAFAPDKIVMSATPIPRTLALTVYGELELITIRQKPKKKASVSTRFVGAKIPEMYRYILDKANKGEQTFIVCPRIDPNEDGEEGNDSENQGNNKMKNQSKTVKNNDNNNKTTKNSVKESKDKENENPLMAATVLYQSLQPIFSDKVGLLHGRMHEKEKAKIMQAFANGDIKVLVATTIVEVGIDIPNATTMVIYNAERYGLSQLHQLRGRIGRGEKDGYCFLLCQSDTYFERLKILESCDDGFALAEKDFELRGAGDFLGTRQHGSSLTFTGEPITADLLKKAKKIAESISESDLKNFTFKSELYFKELALN